MKFAYFVRPHIGGTYTVFKHLRRGLAAYGIEVSWLGIARSHHSIAPEMRGEMACGTLLHMPDQLDERTCARCLAAAIESRDFDGVFINVLSDRIQTNIARYLRENVLRLMVVHNITPGTYAAASSIRSHIHAAIAVSERCRHDLVTRHGFRTDRTFLIPNAVDTEPFRRIRRQRPPGGELKVLSIGRTEDASKGVFWLPDVMDRLPETITLTIAGDGPDMAHLKARMIRHAGRVTYAGSVRPENVPALMALHDVLVMPSRFEGLPLALVEAMAAGCVPVASRIRGVTDTIVDDGVDGRLFPVGDHEMAARLIRELDEDRDLLSRMSLAARSKVDERFSINEMAESYHRVIREITASRPPLSPPLALENWSMPRGLRPGLRTYLPSPMKNWLRTLRERL